MEAMIIDDSETYVVSLNKPVARDHRKYLPRDKHRFKGNILRQISDEYGWEVIDDCNSADA